MAQHDEPRNIEGDDRSSGISAVPTWSGDVMNVIIETPKGQPNKFAFDHELGVMRLKKVLPVGMVFPFDFGFLPGTLADDGDPLDVLVLMDAPVYPGCLVPARLIGVLRCRQTEDGRSEENDRLLAVADASKRFRATDIKDLQPWLLDEIAAFFVDYERVEGRAFRVIRRSGAGVARRVAERAANGPATAGRDRHRTAG